MPGETNFGATASILLNQQNFLVKATTFLEQSSISLTQPFYFVEATKFLEQPSILLTWPNCSAWGDDTVGSDKHLVSTNKMLLRYNQFSRVRINKAFGCFNQSSSLRVLFNPVFPNLKFPFKAFIRISWRDNVQISLFKEGIHIKFRVFERIFFTNIDIA